MVQASERGHWRRTQQRSRDGSSIKHKIQAPRHNKSETHRNPFIFSPSPCSSICCVPSEIHICDVSGTCHWLNHSVWGAAIVLRGKQVYLPRPAMPLSSLGSNEERCENAALRSEAVWTGLVVVAAATGVRGWGLRSPVRLSRGTGVMDAAVTSPVLTWGFTWFLLGWGTRQDEQGQNLF